MRKLFLVLAISTSLALPVYGSSLSDIAGQNSTQTVQPSTQPQSQSQVQSQTQPQVQAGNNSGSSGSSSVNIKIDKTRSDIVNDLAGAADFSGDSQIAKEFQNSTRPFTMAVMQILSWVIMFFLGLSVILDILYLVAPPLRGILSGGAGATSATSGTATSGSFGGGFNSGMGGGFGSGMGGFNSGIGGGFGSGMSNPTPVKPAGGAGFCLVSQEAINAATAVNPQTGQLKSSMAAYAKTAWIKLVLTPIMLVLTLTGTLQQIGFTLVSIIINIVKSII